MAINTAARTMTTQPGLGYLPGMRVRAANVANPDQWIEVPVTTYNVANGQLTFTPDLILSSGTFANWNVSRREVGFASILTGADLNNYRTPGFYFSTLTTIANSPIAAAFSLIVEQSGNGIKQTWASAATVPQTFVRASTTATGAFGAWIGTTTSTLIPTGSDLNNYRTEGMYYATVTTGITGVPNAVGPTATPVPLSVAFSLLVERVGAGQKQTLTTATTTPETYTRASTSAAGAFGVWQRMFDRGRLISAGADLDNYRSAWMGEGMWGSTSTGIANSPVAAAFSLLVIRAGSTGTTQIWMNRATGDMWARSHTTTSNAWSQWVPSGQTVITDGRRIFMAGGTSPVLEDYWHRDDVADHNDDIRRLTINSGGSNILYGNNHYYYNKVTEAVTTNLRQLDLRCFGDNVLNVSHNLLTGLRSTALRNIGSANVILAEHNPALGVNQTTHYDGSGVARMVLFGDNTTSFTNGRLTNVARGVASSDAATVGQLRSENINIGEFFPAVEVANRAAVVTAVGTTTITESFETGLGTILPVVRNFIGQDSQPSVASITGNGFERTNIRAQQGTWSIQSLNHNVHSTRATIIFDIGTSLGTRTLTFWRFSSGEINHDYCWWEVLDIVTGATVVQGTASGSQNTGTTWTQQSLSIPAGRHHLILKYRKDGSVHSAEDRGFFDNISFPRANTQAAGAAQAWVFPESGNWIHAFFHENQLFETRLRQGQSFRNPTTRVLRVFDGTNIVNA